MSDSWQKCPVCNGGGVIEKHDYHKDDVLGLHDVKCHVCKGAGIINAATGAAPSVTPLKPKKAPIHYDDKGFFCLACKKLTNKDRKITHSKGCIYEGQ